MGRGRIIDISVPITENMAVWAGDSPPRFEFRSRAEEDGATLSVVTLGSHSGTHVDAPWHFVSGGGKVESIELEWLVGPCQVLDLSHLPPDGQIEVEHLGDYLPLPSRLILKTTNSRLWQERPGEFSPEFVSLSPKAAALLVQEGVRLVGIDYLSIERFRAPGHPVHKTLLEAGVVILEGLDLSSVSAGRHQLVALPPSFVGLEGAPVRAVLLETD